jgi:hypothetical protein
VEAEQSKEEQGKEKLFLAPASESDGVQAVQSLPKQYFALASHPPYLSQRELFFADPARSRASNSRSKRGWV